MLCENRGLPGMFRFVGESESNPQLTVEIKSSKGTSRYAKKDFRVLKKGLPGINGGTSGYTTQDIYKRPRQTGFSTVETSAIVETSIKAPVAANSGNILKNKGEPCSGLPLTPPPGFSTKNAIKHPSKNAGGE